MCAAAMSTARFMFHLSAHEVYDMNKHKVTVIESPPSIHSVLGVSDVMFMARCASCDWRSPYVEHRDTAGIAARKHRERPGVD